jgi:Fur family transcriptional regulator, ferric uptake regulator
MTQAQTPVVNDEPLIQPICSIFRRFLKRKGLKFTTERALILNSVLDKQEVFEADQLLEEMHAAGHEVSKATIYRTIKHLVEARIITPVLIDPNQAHYELTFGREPRGHLVCIETAQIIEFSTAELKEMTDRIAKQHGYEPMSFRFVIYGVSSEGKKQAQQDSGA